MMNSNQSNTFPNWSARQVVLATLYVTAVIFGFWLLYRYHMALVLLFASVILGTALTPMVGKLTRHAWTRPAAIALTYAIILAVIATFLFLVMPTLVQQALDLAVSLPNMYNDLHHMLIQSQSMILWNIGLRLPINLNIALTPPPDQGEPLAAVSTFMGFSGAVLNLFLALGLVFLMTTFWILESDRILRGLLLLVPPGNRESIHGLWKAIEARLAAFVRGQLILVLSIGGMALTAYLIIGLPNALALAMVAGLLELIPVIGPALGSVPALLVAYSLDPMTAVWVLVSFVIIQVTENYVLMPRVVGSSVGVNPITTLLTLAAFGSLLGLPGALLAIPVAAVIQLLLDRFVLSKDQYNGSTPAGRDLTSALRYEVQDLIGDVRKQLRKKGNRSSDGSDELEDAIESLAVELDLLLSQEDGREI